MKDVDILLMLVCDCARDILLFVQDNYWQTSLLSLLSLGRQKAWPSDIVNGSDLESYVHMSTIPI